MSRSLDLSILQAGCQVHDGQESLCNCDGLCKEMMVRGLSQADLGRIEQFVP